MKLLKILNADANKYIMSVANKLYGEQTFTFKQVGFNAALFKVKNMSMGPELIGDNLSPSSRGGWWLEMVAGRWWVLVGAPLECVHRQIT